jgi:hypothetical protein
MHQLRRHENGLKFIREEARLDQKVELHPGAVTEIYLTDAEQHANKYRTIASWKSGLAFIGCAIVGFVTSFLAITGIMALFGLIDPPRN